MPEKSGDFDDIRPDEPHSAQLGLSLPGLRLGGQQFDVMPGVRVGGTDGAGRRFWPH